MKLKIGNIITKRSDLPDYFNVFGLDNFKADDSNNTLPTLLIGLRTTLDLYPDNVKLGDKNLEGKIYWEFDIDEDRSEYEKGLIGFTMFCVSDIKKKIPYIYIDLIKTKSLYNILRPLYGKDNKTLFYKDAIYIFNGETIYGLDSRMIKLVGCDIDKVKVKILKHSVAVSDKLPETDKILLGGDTKYYTLFI